MRKRLGRWWPVLLASWLLATPAQADSFGIVVEFDDGTFGDFGTLDVTENGGDLDIVISLNTSVLGPTADINEFYFNLVGVFTGLAVSSTDPVNTPYDLIGPDPPVRGGAGSSFEWGVNLGNGAGPSGNGVLNVASFTLSADQPLSIASLIEESFPNEVDPPVHFAVHVQGTNIRSAQDSETIGGTVPEPHTAALFALGLLGLAVASRGRSFSGPRGRAPA